MQYDEYRGVRYRAVFDAGGDEFTTFAVHVDAPALDFGFVASKKNRLDVLKSLLQQGQTVITDDRAFDAAVSLRSASPTLAAAFFHSQDKRAALRLLLDIGFTEVVRTRTCVSAIRKYGPFQRRPDTKKALEQGVPQLAVLAEMAPAPAAVPESAVGTDEKQAARLEALVQRKDAMVAACLALLPAIAPAAYLYVGGWRFGVVSAAFLALLIYATIGLAGPALVPAVGALYPAAIWKAVAACNLRNKLVGDNAVVSPREFGSFRYAGFAMTDLLLGYCMALAPGILLMRWARSTVDTEVIAQYLLMGTAAAWLTELAAGYLLLRASEAIAGAENPFLEPQQLRWRRIEQGEPGGIPRLRITTYLPTAREALRAAALALVVPVFVALSQV